MIRETLHLILALAIVPRATAVGGHIVQKIDRALITNSSAYTALHISRHTGCMREIHSFTNLLGIEMEVIFYNGPLKVTKELANELWKKHKNYYNNFDYIVTTDTTPISRIFLENMDEVKPKLIIYVSNRWDVGYTQGHDDWNEWRDTFRKVNHYPDQITVVPFCDFETAYAEHHGIPMKHFQTIYPLGDLPPPGGTYEDFANEHDKGAYGPAGDPWAGRGVAGPEDHFDTYYVAHYANEQDNHVLDDCKKHGVKCFLGYADDIQQFKAMVVFPYQTCNIAPFDSFMRGNVVISPSHKLLKEASNTPKIPGYEAYTFASQGIENATEYCTWLKFPECRIQFDTFDELFELLKTLDETRLKKVRAACRGTITNHRFEVVRQWRETFNVQALSKRENRVYVDPWYHRQNNTVVMCKSFDANTIYLLAKKTLRPFFSLDAFTSRGFDLDEVEQLSLDEFSGYTIGEFLK